MKSFMEYYKNEESEIIDKENINEGMVRSSISAKGKPLGKILGVGIEKDTDGSKYVIVQIDNKKAGLNKEDSMKFLKMLDDTIKKL